MMGLPLNDGACAWVTRSLERDLSGIERELVTVLCTALATGPWNVHRTWSIMKECGRGATMSIDAHRLCSYDNDGLTRLVFAAHDRCCRVELSPAGPQRISVRIWKRERTGGIAQRHPSLRAAVDSWEEYVWDRNGVTPE